MAKTWPRLHRQSQVLCADTGLEPNLTLLGSQGMSAAAGAQQELN